MTSTADDGKGSEVNASRSLGARQCHLERTVEDLGCVPIVARHMNHASAQRRPCLSPNGHAGIAA